jgi:hypothetical protein
LKQPGLGARILRQNPGTKKGSIPIRLTRCNGTDLSPREEGDGLEKSRNESPWNARCVCSVLVAEFFLQGGLFFKGGQDG